MLAPFAPNADSTPLLGPIVLGCRWLGGETWKDVGSVCQNCEAPRRFHGMLEARWRWRRGSGSEVPSAVKAAKNGGEFVESCASGTA